MKVDRVVLKETRYLSIAVALCSLIMQGIFLILGKYDYTVFLGALLGGVAAILNFLCLGLAVQKATTMEAADAKKHMQASYSLRYLALGVVVVIGVVAPIFHWLPVALSLVFPRLWFLIMPAVRKDMKKDEENT